MTEDFLLAADVGNARLKLGLFAKDDFHVLPQPRCTISLDCRRPRLSQVKIWLDELWGERLAWHLASVNPPAVGRLLNWLKKHRPQDSFSLLNHASLPLKIRLERPEQAGIDRLVNAMAADRLRPPDRPAVVVDLGTAVTVDLLSAEGEFLGGAILPGLHTAAKALHQSTALLPLVDVKKITALPPVLGAATIPAIESGLLWGAIGAIRFLAARLLEHAGSSLSESPVYLTGGGVGLVPVENFGPHARFVEHLTLAGIALAATS